MVLMFRPELSREHRFELDGQEKFLELADVRFFTCQEDVLHDLLCDRAAATSPSPACEVIQKGSGGPFDAETVMVVKPGILCCEDGIREVR